MGTKCARRHYLAAAWAVETIDPPLPDEDRGSRSFGPARQDHPGDEEVLVGEGQQGCHMGLPLVSALQSRCPSLCTY